MPDPLSTNIRRWQHKEPGFFPKFAIKKSGENREAPDNLPIPGICQPSPDTSVGAITRPG